MGKEEFKEVYNEDTGLEQKEVKIQESNRK